MSCSVVSAEEEEEEGDEEAEKAFLQFYINVPAVPPLSQVLRDPERRRKLGEFMHSMFIFSPDTVVETPDSCFQ